MANNYTGQPVDEEAIYLFLKSALAQAILIGHWSTGRIYYATEAAAELLGVRPSLLYGMSALQFFADPEQRLHAMRRLKSPDSVVRAELRLRSFDGRDLCVLADLGRITYRSEPALILVLNDVTEYKVKENDWRERHQQALDASQAKSQFLARMSHELRSPLNAILGFAEILRDDSLGAATRERYREYAGLIHRAGQHLLGVINDVLDLSKIEAGRMEFDLKTVDISEICMECIALLQAQAARRQIRLSLRCIAPRPAFVRADRKRCRQIFINLIANAIKFTRPGGSVWIEVERRQQDLLSVTVADTGIGMDEAQIKTALEPFGQIPQAFDEPGSNAGTGLGLPIVRSLIEAQGGTFRIESQPGEGTRATAFFPAAQL